MGIAEILQGLSIVAAIVGGAWALLKLAARQVERSLDARFEAQEKLRKEASAEYRRRFDRLDQAERDFRNFQTEVHRDFIRREDYVRDIASIKTMIDNLALNIQKNLSDIWQQMRGRES